MPANSRWDLIRRLRVNLWITPFHFKRPRYLALRTRRLACRCRNTDNWRSCCVLEARSSLLEARSSVQFGVRRELPVSSGILFQIWYCCAFILCVAFRCVGRGLAVGQTHITVALPNIHRRD